MHAPNERRAHPRAPFPGHAVVYVGDRRHSVSTVDVSESGIGVELADQGPVGTFVRVNFHVGASTASNAPWLDADGVVVRSQPLSGRFVWGIQFLGMPTTTAAGIRAHLAGPPTTPAPAKLPRPRVERAPTPVRARPSIPPVKVPPATPARDPLPRAEHLRGLYRSALEQVAKEGKAKKKR